MKIQAKLFFDLVGPSILARFDARCEHPMAEQEKLLRALLHENAETEFGRRYGFADIESFSGFQKRVPISEYDDIEPYIEAARNGHPAQLTRERPVFYSITSGTTGASKHIPVTPASRRAKSRLMLVWLSAFFRDHAGVLDGRILQVFSPETEELAPDGTPCGSEVGHAYRNMPRLMRGLYPVPYPVCEIPDYDARYYSLLRIAAGHSLTAIGTPNPSSILILARYLGEQTERMVRDVRDGTLDEKLELPAPIRAAIEEGLKPDPDRAAFLERAASLDGGRLLPVNVWPELEVLACWKGGTVGPYLDQLAPYFPESMAVRDLGWLSSECRGSVPLSDESQSGPLAIATNVYEFSPADIEEDPEPTDLLSVDQLEPGKRYYVFVTTAGGLFRYPMHDILEVTGFYRRTPSVRFVHKGKGIVNFTGEKLTEAQVLAAVGDTIDPRRTDRGFIAAVGRAGGNSHDPSYLFLVEFEDPPDDGEAERVAGELDRALARHNIEYASKRKSGRLGPAVLRVLEPGQFEAYHRRAIERGGHDGQFKILRLTDDEGFADEFDRVVGDYRAA